jgi:hypothetical protein
MWYTDEKAVDELGTVGSTKLSCSSFRAFTVLLIGILALGARYTPEMYTVGVTVECFNWKTKETNSL